MRYLIIHPQDGIYLGNCLGFGFFTKLDPVGQDAAVTFETQTDAEEHILSWNEPLPGCNVVSINIDHMYATISECVAAGFEAWDPNGYPQQTTERTK